MSRPDCVVVPLPMRVDRVMGYLLPDVPVNEQVFVLDPNDPTWLHVVHRDNEAAMADWLRWYHSRLPEPRPSDKRCGS